MMTREETESAMLSAEVDYATTCKNNTKRLLDPVRKELSRLNALARKTKDGKVKVLKAWLALHDAGAVPKEPADASDDSEGDTTEPACES